MPWSLLVSMPFTCSPPPPPPPRLVFFFLCLSPSFYSDREVEIDGAHLIKPENPLWQERPDVVSAGFLKTLDKKEVKRQEAIHEFVLSEAAYLRDLHVLMKVYLQPLWQQVTDADPKKQKAFIDKDLLEVSKLNKKK